jgi:hypothetical protein
VNGTMDLGAAGLQPSAIAVGIVLRSLAATALALAASHYLARDAVAPLLPGLAKLLAWVADDFEIVRFEFFTDRGQLTIGALARVDHTLFLGGRAIVPDGHQIGVVGTTVGTVLQPLLVAFVLVLAWPARWLELVLRLPVAALLLAVVMLIDTPFSLAAWLWDAQLRQYEPGRASPLIWWNTFLNGGGRLALGLVAGALAIVLARRWR